MCTNMSTNIKQTTGFYYTNTVLRVRHETTMSLEQNSQTKQHTECVVFYLVLLL